MAKEPGRDVNVAHPDYKPPMGHKPPARAEDPDGHLSLDTRRLKHGHGGFSAHESARAQAELDREK